MKKQLARQKFVPLVLMLEPLFACNLKCATCGRIREYKDRASEMMSLDECVGAATECGAPVVSVCGGEPLIYPHIVPLIEALTSLGRYVYLCTNGVKLVEAVESLRPSKHLLINVHLDGPADVHDALVCKNGAFESAVNGIVVAAKKGFQVTVNTTVCRQTNMNQLDALMSVLGNLGVNCFMLSPAYSYESVDSQGLLHEPRGHQGEVQGHRPARRPPQPGRLADLPGIPQGRERTQVHGLGQPHPESRRLAVTVLSACRPPLSHLQRADRKYRLALLWRRQRSSMPRLHGPLRFRADGRPDDRQTARRPVENGQVAIRMRRVFVTGGTGFVGAHVVRKLVERGDHVIALARRKADTTLLNGLPVEIVPGDITDMETLLWPMRRCDEIYHIAADYRLWARQPEEIYYNNVIGTLNVMEAALRTQAPRVVYTSTVGCLGIPRDGSPGDESTPVKRTDLVGHYKKSKYDAEKTVLEYVDKGLNAVIVNPSTPVGPGESSPPRPAGSSLTSSTAACAPTWTPA